MIKWEILLWLLLTLVLLLTPLVFLAKNYKYVGEKWLTTLQNYLQWLQDKATSSLENIRKNIPEVVPEQNIVVKEKKIPEPARKIIEMEEPAPTVKDIRKEKVEKTQEQLIQDQKQKEKAQKKIHEVKMSALTHKERGRLDDFEKKLIEWLALDPDNIEFQTRLSDYYFDQGNYVKAQSILKKIVNSSPSNHKAIRQIGQIYVHQNDLDTAKILIEKAISVKQDNPKYWISLVDIQYSQWLIKDALQSMEKVLKLRPTKIDYLLWIASLHEENSEPNKARMYYSKIIELDPLQEDAKHALERLQ